VPVPGSGNRFAEPATTEAATAVDEGPAQPADVTPVEVIPDDDGEVEVVDADVVEDPEPQPARSESANGKAAAAADAEEPEPAHSRGFEGDDMLAARLVALQMAVAGSARDEVEDHLRKAFSLEEPGKILNDVFGTESKL
jgi:hypothetical protein